MCVDDDHDGFALVGAEEGVDAGFVGFGFVGVPDVGVDGAASEGGDGFSDGGELLDVGEDGVMSIPRFVVWVEVGVEFEDRGVGVEHVFAVGGVVSAHEALFGAVVDAWDAALSE